MALDDKIYRLRQDKLKQIEASRVFSSDTRPGQIVIETGALDEPGPGPLDGLKFIVECSQQLGIWREYLEDALRITGGHVGLDP